MQRASVVSASRCGVNARAVQLNDAGAARVRTGDAGGTPRPRFRPDCAGVTGAVTHLALLDATRLKEGVSDTLSK